MSETITAAEYRQAPKPKKNKYGAKKVREDGHLFDSKAEYRRYCVLKRMELDGLISSLKVHPKFEFTVNGRSVLTRSDGYPNGRRVTCKWDFGYLQVGAGVVYEDIKSGPTKTEAYRLRRAFFEAFFYPAQVIEVTA